jgi:hypothetical protein
MEKFMTKTISFWLCLLFSTQTAAQHPLAKAAAPRCAVNTNAADETSWGWPTSTHVTVYALRNEFAPTELVAITRAIDHWNAALTGMDIDVSFAFGGERDGTQSFERTITIRRGSTYQNHRHLAEIYPTFRTSEYLFSALIIIDKGVSDRDTLASVLTHELGHSLGMDDCPRCQRGTTIMALYRGRNQGNDTDSPTTCDRATVARRYRN